MSDTYKGLTVKIGADTSSLSSALRKARSEVSGISSELRKVQKALKLDPGNTRLLAQQQEDYKRQISATTKELDLLMQAEKKLQHEMSADFIGPVNAEAQQEQWRKLQSDIAMTEIKLKGYKQALADSVIQQGVAESALGKLGSKFETMGDRLNSAGRKMETMGSTLTRTVSTGIVAAGAASVAAAVNIDTSMTNVKKTVDGTADQYDKLKEKAIEFSKTNAVGADQILDIQALGAQLGFSIEELDEFGRIVSGLDIATNMDADTAATEMAQFANITKMSHDEISNYGSAIVGLGNNFATTESDISSMAMRIAAAGTQVGMSQADILGLATALSSMGVEAEAGGTAISTIMAQIDKDIATNADSVETWASTAGMSAQDFADAWRSDPVDALSALLTNMESATEEGGNMSVMLQELGIDSIRQTDIMKRLGGNSELVADAVAKSNEEWGKNTALQKEVDNRNESLAAKFEMLKNRVVAVANDVGGPLADALLDVIDSAEPLIQMIADGAKQFNEMSKSEQNAVIKAVALSAAIGPMLNIFGKGVQQISGFGKGLQKLAQFFATVDYKTSGASRGLKDFDGAAKASESSTKKQATAVKASSVAMGAAKSAAMGVAGILAGMLLTAIFNVANGIAEAKKRSDEIKTTNSELSSSLNGLETGASNASESLGNYGQTVASVKGQADDLKQAHADLAKSLSDTMTEAGASAGMLDSYVETIDELGTKSDLTKEEQARLKDAVDRVNEACGTTFAVTDDVNGALYGQVDAIKAVVSAQQDKLRYEAASEGWKETLKQQEADLMRIKELEQQRSDLAEKHAGQTKAQWGEDAEVYNELGNALSEARSQYGATSDAVKRYEDRVGELGAAMGSSTEEMGAFVSTNEAIAAALESTGQSADGFSEALAQYGVSVTDLADLSDDKLAAIAQSYDGNVESIIGILQEFGIVAKEEGAEAAENYADGLSEGADAAVSAAAEIAGKTVDEIRGECDQFGIEGDEAVKAYADAIASGKPQAEAVAIALGQSVSGGIQSETPNVVQASLVMKDGILQAYDPVTGELSAVTQETMNSILGSIAGSTPMTVQSITDLENGMVTAYNPLTGDLENISLSAVQTAEGTIRKGEPGFTDAVRAMKDNGTGTLQLIEGEWRLVGENATSNLGGGMNENMDVVEGSVDDTVSTVDGIKDAGSDSYTWGLHVIGNFARGISSGVGGVLAGALNEASAKVQAILGHSVPKEGAMRNGGKGEAEWGEHSVQNFTGGIRKQMPNLQRTMEEVAAITAGGYTAKASSVSLASQRMAKQPSGNGISVTVDQRGGMTESQVYSAVRSAMSDAISRQDGRPIVIQLNEREMARVVRSII
ncbi:phage tail tape measure protein [Raoultibacter timonensis]|uniref:Phage tail tape measure protein domain-containing protein n=1 Tax=Raoultibacter timonensis TaxID=1907662 RepID=A0ABM7WFE6_9ACTN|nr:phage tail tape measure protein [Raoultibacter timonensis]BDE94954.1 hypothetical protein CE91St30_02870 [Raoultibacter timonensis]BDF49557.1 hypothetical protein CE91St31_02870 [Raoultibacter timonensis]